MDRLTKDADNMIEIMVRTADRADIWQDRLIYHMAKAIFDIIMYLHKAEERRAAARREYGNGS